MRVRTFFRHLIALPVATLLATGGHALAKQKGAKSQVSYERAWSICRDFVADEKLGWDQTQARYARMGACMKEYGYRL